MEYNFFKDWVRIKYDTILSETIQQLSLKRFIAPMIHLYHDDGSLNMNLVSDLNKNGEEIMRFDGIDYYEINKEKLETIPFDFRSLKDFESVPIKYNKDWFTIYRDGNPIETKVTNLIVIDKNDKILQEYKIKIKELYEVYMFNFSKEDKNVECLSPEEFYKLFEIKEI